MNRKKLNICLAVLLATFTSFSVLAEPRTVSTTISKMRPYTTGDYFITLASNQLTNGSTCTTTYRVKSDDPGSKAVIASLLTAFASGGNVQIEVPTSTGCEGFGTPIQSVFMSE